MTRFFTLVLFLLFAALCSQVQSQSGAGYESTEAVVRTCHQEQYKSNGTDPQSTSCVKGDRPSVTLSKQQRLLRLDSEWKNSLFLWALPQEWTQAWPDWVQVWARNYIAGCIVYYAVSGLWAYYIYICFRAKCFGDAPVPKGLDMWEQVKVATYAIPMYSLLPTLSEHIVIQGYTKAYARIDEVGLPAYIGYFAIYMCIVEFGVYWAHRLLHEIRVGYNWLHYVHHKYNKENSLSPFAGLAFQPLDGILQAVPYVLAMFIVPLHFTTHEILLFATAVWTTNIHDTIGMGPLPIMGANYHTIHHITYKHNYGHYFVFMDWLFGTLKHPKGWLKED